LGVAELEYEKLERGGGSWELGAGRIKCKNGKSYLNSAAPIIDN
jgi:hypothetical protein